VRLVVRNLQRRPRRTLLTIAGLALGAGSYMVLVGTAHGFLFQFGELARFCGGDIVVHQVAAASPWSSNLVPAQVTALAGLPGVSRLSRLALGRARLFGSPYFLIFGADPTETLARRIPIVEGRPLQTGGENILVGEVAARKLKLAVGQSVQVRGRSFVIAGVYRTGFQVFDAGAVVDIPTFQTLFNLFEVVNLVFLELANPAQRGEVLAAIAARFPTLEANAWESWVFAYGQMTLVETMARLIALLAVLIAASGVANVMHIAVSERTQELAILRAIGWRRARVAALVLQEGAGLSLLGGLCGVPLAAAVFWLLDSKLVISLGTAGFIPFHLPLSAALEGVAVTMLAGILGTLPPLLRALRVRPAEALHMPA
jgi:ABC-type lipoprotein release transport system permease subunit